MFYFKCLHWQIFITIAWIIYSSVSYLPHYIQLIKNYQLSKFKVLSLIFQHYFNDHSILLVLHPIVSHLVYFLDTTPGSARVGSESNDIFNYSGTFGLDKMLISTHQTVELTAELVVQSRRDHFSGKDNTYNIDCYVLLLGLPSAQVFPWHSPFFLLHKTGNPNCQLSTSSSISVLILKFIVTCEVSLYESSWHWREI